MSMPAARLLDLHVCPMITVLVPHVGGPIAGPGAPNVLIGGFPAARVTDMCVCVGPPDVIAMGSFTVLIAGLPAARVMDITAHGGMITLGCPTVLIGDSGGGAGSAPAFTMSAARASGAAFTRTTCAAEGAMAQVKDSPLLAAPNPQKSHWIEIELVDQKGKPVAHERYRIVPPDQKPVEGFLDDKGFARVPGLDAGTCTISFPDLDAATWKPEKGDPGRVEPVPTQPKYRPGVQAARFEQQSSGRPSVKAVKLEKFVLNRPGVSAVALSVAVAARPGVARVTFAVVGRPGIGSIQLSILSRPSVSNVELTQLARPGVESVRFQKS